MSDNRIYVEEHKRVIDTIMNRAKNIKERDKNERAERLGYTEEDEREARELLGDFVNSVRGLTKRFTKELGDTEDANAVLLDLLCTVLAEDEGKPSEGEDFAVEASLNFEQSILHRVAAIFGGKNKHPYNIPSLRKVYSKMLEELAHLKKEVRLNRLPKEKQGSEKQRKHGLSSRHEKQVHNRTRKEVNRITENYKVRPQDAAADHRLIHKVRHRTITQRYNNRHADRATHTAEEA